MLEDAGCSLLAVHGRTRDEKDGKKIRANWDAIRDVKSALKIQIHIQNGTIDQGDLVVDYLKLCEKYLVPWRMIRSHVHKMWGIVRTSKDEEQVHCAQS
ncbi:tRNA-dihydrouridine(16/17) synthase [NAD(P)(+)]-like protein [Tanacetum coccineum]